MAATIDLPGIGPVNKTTALMLGGGVALVGGVAWYRSRHAAAAATAAPADPSAGQVDPATGYPAGSPQDQAALAAQASAGGYGGYGGGGANVTPAVNPQGYTTNAQWAQAAEEYLTTTVQADPNTVGNALGKYITGQPVTGDQVTIIEESIAFAGYPPANGPTGHPPAYITASTTPPPTGGGSGGGGGGSGGGKPGKQLGAPTGLHATSVGRTAVTLAWHGVTGAIGYRVYEDAFGADVGEATGTTQVVHNLSPHHKYKFRINALGIDGQTGPASASITVTTKK